MAFSYNQHDRQQPDQDPLNIIIDRSRSLEERRTALNILLRDNSPNVPRILNSLLNGWEDYKNLDDITLARGILDQYVEKKLEKQLSCLLEESFLNLLFSSLPPKNFVDIFCDSNIIRTETLCIALQQSCRAGKKNPDAIVCFNLFEEKIILTISRIIENTTEKIEELNYSKLREQLQHIINLTPSTLADIFTANLSAKLVGTKLEDALKNIHEKISNFGTGELSSVQLKTYIMFDNFLQNFFFCLLKNINDFSEQTSLRRLDSFLPNWYLDKLKKQFQKFSQHIPEQLSNIQIEDEKKFFVILNYLLKALYITAFSPNIIDSKTQKKVLDLFNSNTIGNKTLLSENPEFLKIGCFLCQAIAVSIAHNPDHQLIKDFYFANQGFYFERNR
ncbi:MAG TPA: hypothetical protein PKD37_00515 [Oligoflexia bacterium]|nr:hypothetical protein [Oligoflexia bacterium]HMP26463.1 hypothetical protein [Oligoflexia bacterium]